MRRITGSMTSLFLLGAIAGLTFGCGSDNDASVPTQQPVPAPSSTPLPSATPSPTVTPSTSPSPSVSVSIPQGAVGKGPAAYGINPLMVVMGTTVTWTNNDTLPHTVTADDNSFDSGTIQPGQSYSHTFGTAGSYTYFCSIHGKASMSGAVQVMP
jgi:plastocyanin